jgi:hypothetical protein
MYFFQRQLNRPFLKLRKRLSLMRSDVSRTVLTKGKLKIERAGNRKSKKRLQELRQRTRLSK